MTKPGSVLAIALQAAALTGALHQNATASPNSGAQAKISERVTRVREIFAQRTKEPDNGLEFRQFAQWVNWNNWGNWNNWANWPNWSNWGNWTKY